MHSSTIFTIGTALRRAGDSDMPVEVLVEGNWLRGTVAGVDGHGLVLTTITEHCVVRLEAVSAVRIPEAVPESPVAETFDPHHALAMHQTDDEGAWIMPGSVNA